MPIAEKEDTYRALLGTIPQGEFTGGAGRAGCPAEVVLTIRHREGGPWRTIDGREVTAYEEIAITGSVWMPSRRDIYTGGQCDETIRQFFGKRPRVARILEIWDRWHLNGMRAGCVHQGNPDDQPKIVIVTYRETDEASRARHKIERWAEERLKMGHAVQYSTEELAHVRREWEIKIGADLPAPGPAYEEHSREEKSPGWVRPDEHPRGMLTKPCDVCGYKYGTAWLVEPCPPEVVAEAIELFTGKG